jgi:F-type H+-transporting ATPase subunit delta
MSVQTVARRYAFALADVVAESGEAREVQQELKTWEQMLQSHDELRTAFANPTIPLDQKRAVLNRLIELSRPRKTTINFLKVLLQNQRLTELSEINKRFDQVLDERAGLVAATVTTARPIPKDVHDRLEGTLRSLTGKKVRIDFATDPELLGGVVTRIGSTVYDGSVRNQLQQIKEKMTS